MRRHIAVLGGEIGAAKFDREQAAVRQIVERDPDNVMLNGVWVRNTLADGDLDIERLSMFDCLWQHDCRNVLFGFPVGGFDMVCYAHDLFGIVSLC